MELLIFVANLFFVVVFWNMATGNFEEGENRSGWFNLFLSALNGASVMLYVF